ncbi:SPFH domain-containing protein [Streptomyces sp. NPDC001594]|uniref:SPFH domain-containing protein n=1 Tax=Streptomyces sp. NPDC001594 TaxID=3364590 RepID=UPI0036BA2F26
MYSSRAGQQAPLTSPRAGHEAPATPSRPGHPADTDPAREPAPEAAITEAMAGRARTAGDAPRGPARVGTGAPEHPTAPAPRTAPDPHATRAEPQHPATGTEFHPPAARTEPRPATAPQDTPATRVAPEPATAPAPRAEHDPATAPVRTSSPHTPATREGHEPPAPPAPRTPASPAEPQAPGVAAEGGGQGYASHPKAQPPAPTAPQPPAGIPHPQGAGVPGPGVAEIVARAVARGIEGGEGARGETPGGPLARRTPPRGAAVTAVPVHLPFSARPVTAGTPGTATGTESATATAPAHRPAERAASTGRRVPRGDERLREHRGPVLPGWIAVVVGALALTGCAAVLWRAGVVPAALVAAFGVPPRPYHGLRATHWPPLAFLGVVTLLALGGLGRARAGHAWVLTLFGSYRGTVRRTGLTWISPLLLRRRVDVRLRHWRSEPMPAVDSGGLALQVVVQVVWQVRDTARATLAVEDHIDYLAEQVESATTRVLSRLPADAFHDDAPTLRDAEAVGEALTRTLAAETEAIGIEVFSAQPTRIEYAPEVAEAMRRRRIAAIDAKHRDSVLTAVVDAVDDTVHRLTSRGIVELDDYERKVLVKDLTVAFYTGRSDQ